MLGPVHHVGYLADDLEAGAALLREMYDLTPQPPISLPDYGVEAMFLDAADGSVVEVFTVADAAARDRRLAGTRLRLDHVAYTVADLDAAIAELRSRGGLVLAPDGSPLDTPLERGGFRHVWTSPAAGTDLVVQLIGP